MRKTIILAMFALVSLVAKAQVTWNFKAGFGFSQCLGMNDEGKSSGKFVWKIGMGAEIPLTGDLMLMPSFEYANKGAKWKLDNDKETISMDYLQIPALIAYRIPIKASNITFKVGPYFAYAIYGKAASTKYEDLSGSDFFNEGAKRFDLGIDLGVDWEYHKFVVGVEYERGFTKMIDSEDLNIYNSAVYFTVGYKF